MHGDRSAGVNGHITELFRHTLVSPLAAYRFSLLSFIFLCSQYKMEDDSVPEVPLALVSNLYLEKKAFQVKQKSILWEVRMGWGEKASVSGYVADMVSPMSIHPGL